MITGVRILVSGRVQGVGFRPYLARLARKFSLSGEARNVPEGVEIKVFGKREALQGFLHRLRPEAPEVSHIKSLSVSPVEETPPETFRITLSREGVPQTYVPPDMATCKACLEEFFTPSDRRYLYPFTNCTDCGPRYTVIEALPYDRKQTSMRVFPMCPECEQEYLDPESRRFHAEPNACPVCGPRIWITEASGKVLEVENIWDFVVRSLKEGAIWAIKGLGGFHLVCDAENESAVGKLRERKKRPTKPFAVMVRDLKRARLLAEISAVEAEALLSRTAPIVLSRKRSPFPLAEGVAPGIALVGLMLPYTPLHHILLQAWPGLALIMTSGNLSEEPLCYRNEEALTRLKALADYFLFHNREIVAPVDDSVVRFSGKTRMVVRRARGLAPEPLPLPRQSPPILAVGPLLKNTFALTREAEAFLSPHLGDLEGAETLALWERTRKHYMRLFGVKPEVVVSDLHPDYLSTRLAEEIAEREGLLHLKIQHHAAHAYAALGPRAGGKALGLILDGAGLGADGTIWGGEILLLDGPHYRKVGGLSPFLLPGGEAAEREPWRVALALLKDLYGREALNHLTGSLKEIPEENLRAVWFQIEKRLNTPLTSSAGRLFEAVAVLLGLGWRNHYEGELALKLESLALKAFSDEGNILRGGGEGPLPNPPLEGEGTSPLWKGGHKGGLSPFNLVSSKDFVLQVLADLKRGLPRETIALKFHLGLSEALVKACLELSRKFEVREVALSGGCFQNAIFLKATLENLRKAGLRPVFSEAVPPNDGGVSYGQAVWASLGHDL